MKPDVLLHRLALLLLAVVAAMSFEGVIRFPIGPWPQRILQFVFGVALWGWLLQRLWRQPRRWSLRVGHLFLFMLCFQTYLWRRALAGPLPEQLGESRSPWVFALYELPLVAGAVCCLCLRWSYSPAPVATGSAPQA